jgi:DNA-3-methyladenine glycosylase II
MASAVTTLGSMWFDQTETSSCWVPGARHLSRVDPVMKAIIKKVGPCPLKPRRDYFVVLCQSIFSQQISTKVAAILFGRFRNQFPQRRPTPSRVIELLSKAPETLNACGLSRSKQAYILDLARHFESSKLRTSRFCRMTDEQIIEALTEVKGIGRWTAEMFLMFTLNRPDVYPVDDLGVRKSIQRAYALKAMPTLNQLHELAEPWKPHRSLATWYLWRMPEKQAVKV